MDHSAAARYFVHTYGVGPLLRTRTENDRPKTTSSLLLWDMNLRLTG